MRSRYKKVEILVDIKGVKPTAGTIEIKENKVRLKNVKINGKLYYPTAKLVNDVEPAGLSVGDKYTYQVNDNDIFTFYVLSIEGDKVNLIMDRNICGSATDANASTNGQAATKDNKCLIAWYVSDNDTSNGPVTALQGLYNATKNWTNVPNMNLEYDDISDNRNSGHSGGTTYGYGTIETTELGIKITKKDKTTEVTREGNKTPAILYEDGKLLKARLPKLEEVYNYSNDNNHCHGGVGTCPSWLTNGLSELVYYPDNDHISGIEGYWLLASNPSSSGYAYIVECHGSIYNYKTSNTTNHGLRAVITVLKSVLP